MQQVTVDGKSQDTDTNGEQSPAVAERAKRPRKRKESTEPARDLGLCASALNRQLGDFFSGVDSSIADDVDDCARRYAAILERLMAAPSWDHSWDEGILKSIDDAIRSLQALRVCISTAPAIQANEHVENSSPPPAPAIPAVTTDLFPIERREDGQWYVIMPNGDATGPYNAKRLALEHAAKCGQLA